jgi:tRNA (uracil-5-)-methyltransferase
MDGLPPLVARTTPEQYHELLRAKVASLEDKLSEATGGAPLPPMEVFESEHEHFRMRASFKIWREADDVHYVMFNRDDARTPHEVPFYPMGSRRICELMPRLLESIREEPILKERINDVRFLTTTTGDALISLTYNRPIDVDGAWEAAARQLAETLSQSDEGSLPAVKIVGRSRKVKIVVGGETVREVLSVRGRGECVYLQAEGAFSQPNAGVCEHMLSWAVDATQGLQDTDLCELYCGGGCFTVALAPNFRRVVATEMSKASTLLAEQNLAANAGCSNVRVARLSAEDFVQAHAGTRRFRRLEEAGIDLALADRMQTLFVDPPRAGLDETCRSLAAGFERVLYVSCNPETLARDVNQLGQTHRLVRVAAFDQFPYTHHLECGALLERR